MAVLADANCLLEVLLPGRLKVRPTRELLGKYNVIVSILSVHIVYYFAVKDGMTITQTSRFLAGFSITDMIAEDYQRALKLIRNNDLEDALQLAVALRNNCDGIITLDKEFAEAYKGDIDFIVPA